MALSVVDLYSKVLPKTNCKDCGFPTCIAFAGMVVSEKHPLENCPHIPKEILEPAKAELEEQYAQGKWLKKDMAKEALDYARERASSMSLSDIGDRIGGTIETENGTEFIRLPYFNTTIHITKDSVSDNTGHALSRNEQTFIFIHMAQGGTASPTGNTKSFKEFPNTVSKIVSMNDHVEAPLIKAFSGNPQKLITACQNAGATDVSERYETCDLAFFFPALPKVPVTLLFWDAQDAFDAQIKLMFDETVIDHLDIEAILFLSEEIRTMLTQTE